jgi:predicted Zn-dependent protease
MKLYFLFTFIFVGSAYSFVPSKTIYDKDLKWSNNNNIIVEFLGNASNQSELPMNEVKQIITSSFLQWAPQANKSVFVNKVNSQSQISSVNTIKFSNNPIYFGAGVLAVTSVSHSAASGEILSADILINDTQALSNRFTTNSNSQSKIFIGDILSHEIGHFFGLGHSDVIGSTMMFSVFKDQASIHADDESGIRNIYQNNSKLGQISGRVVGGNHIAVFGAHVEAISLSHGDVQSAGLSEEDGSFVLQNLDDDDSYIIQISPPKDVTNYPDYYQSIQKEFCNGNSYVSSFFRKCGGRNKGSPQAINLQRQSSVDVGEVTIRCTEDLDTNYLFSKMSNPREPYLLAEGSEVFVGYFSNEEIRNNTEDKSDSFEVDLSHLNFSQNSTYLDITVLINETASNFSAVAKLSNSISTDTVFPQYTVSGKLTNSLRFKKALSSNSFENKFDLNINPFVTNANDSKDIFGNTSVMSKATSTYLVIINITGAHNSGNSNLKDSYPYSDNSSCLESNIQQSTRANTPFESASAAIDEDSQPMSCGTIEIDHNGGSGGGMMSFTLGLLIVFGLVAIQRKKPESFV